MVRHCGCPPGCDHPPLWRAQVLSSADIHCANTMALSVLVVMVLAGMVASNGDAGAAKVFVGSSRAPPKLPSSTGCVPTPIVSEPRSTTIHIWYVTALAPKLKVGLAVHVPLKMVLNTFWDGLVPIPLTLHPHVCPPDTVFVIEVAAATLALTNRSITSLFCMPAGGTIVALVAVVIASSLAGIRDSPTMVIGGPPAAATRSAGIAAPPLMNAELELRKAICACAVLTSVMPASAPISSTARTIPPCRRGSACLRVVRVSFIVISSCFHTLPDLACEKSPTGL